MKCRNFKITYYGLNGETEDLCCVPIAMVGQCIYDPPFRCKKIVIEQVEFEQAKFKKNGN